MGDRGIIEMRTRKKEGGKKVSKSPITKVRHKMKHFLLGFFSSSGRCGLGTPPASVCLVARRARTRLVKRSSTLCAVFAEVSKNEQPKDRARATPSSFDTSLSYVLSHLFPTSIKIGFCLFTRSIDCRKTSSRSNVDRDAIEYTRMKPWPSRTHWSRSVAYSSCPAVSMTSTKHIRLSTTNCFL